MFEYPSATSSSPPPSPQKSHHHSHIHGHGLHRSHSPISHISTLLPHNHHSSQYSPATRAADISRLLDPAYASGSSSGSSTMASPTHHHKHGQTRAYVDRNGDLHDPDYRDFPVLPPTTRAATASRRRRTSNGATRSRSTSRHGDRYSYSLTRPEWERDWSTEVEDCDEDDLEDDETESQSHYSPFASRVATTRRSATIHTTHAYPTYAPYSRYVSEPQPIGSSPAGSYEEEHQIHESPLQESPFYTEESDIFPQEEQKKKKLRRSSGQSGILRRTSKKTASIAHESPVTEKDDEERSPKQQFSIDGDHRDDVPSCTASLRQQWAATVLRFRFGVFHAKRRLSMRRRSSSTT